MEAFPLFIRPGGRVDSADLRHCFLRNLRGGDGIVRVFLRTLPLTWWLFIQALQAVIIPRSCVFRDDINERPNCRAGITPIFRSYSARLSLSASSLMRLPICRGKGGNAGEGPNAHLRDGRPNGEPDGGATTRPHAGP
jgi:hypothetical protein